VTWCVRDRRREGEGRWCEWTVGVLRGAGALGDCVSVGELRCGACTSPSLPALHYIRPLPALHCVYVE
jgi:hypothetical protein